MPCCPSSISFFADVPSTTIVYSDSMKAQFGTEPKVMVYYYDPETEDFYNLNGFPSSSVKFDGGVISIDHGGNASGYVKIS